MIIVPPGARCFDAFSWEHQAALMFQEVNPYQADKLFNWPPFWMQCCFVMGKLSLWLHVPFFRILQTTLVLAETAVIWQAYKIIVLFTDWKKITTICIVGFALNPVAVFLICQHCNFDIFAVLWILCGLHSLILYNKTDKSIYWLGGCFFLGLGVLTKTYPLMLAPLLVTGFRAMDKPTRALGSVLFIGPVFLGISIIYCLAQNEVTENVLHYRALADFYGFPGLIHLFGLDKLVFLQQWAFDLGGLVVLAGSSLYLWYNKFDSKQMILFATTLLLAVPTLNTFGEQYAAWFIYLLVICYACYPELRKLLIGFYIVLSIYFIAYYALLPEMGYSLIYVLTGANTPQMLQEDLYMGSSPMAMSLWPFVGWFEDHEHKTIVNMPLFLLMLYVVYRCAATLWHSTHPPVEPFKGGKPKLKRM